MTVQVFSGEVDESVRHEQQLLEGEIMRLLKLLDMSINHQVSVHSARWLMSTRCTLQPGVGVPQAASDVWEYGWGLACTHGAQVHYWRAGCQVFAYVRPTG
jgi:hypothetical protein